jgi:hypothetical protein
MRKILVTGSKGFIAKHIKEFYRSRQDIQVVGIDRDEFYKKNVWEDKLKNCDFIFHLAGVCKAKDDEAVYKQNMIINHYLLSMLTPLETKPSIVFLSSTHVEKKTGYGLSKKHAGDLFVKYAKENNVMSLNVITPNVFGPYANINYTSVVANFCDSLILTYKPVITNGAFVSLLYVKDLLECIDKSISNKTGFLYPKGVTIEVSALYQLLQKLSLTYESSGRFECDSRFEFDLLTTYLSYRLLSDFMRMVVKVSHEKELIFFNICDLYKGRVEGGYVRRIYFKCTPNFNVDVKIINTIFQISRTVNLHDFEWGVIDIPPFHEFEIKNNSDNSAAICIQKIDFNTVILEQ